jgi:hypothetical protein
MSATTLRPALIAAAAVALSATLTTSTPATAQKKVNTFQGTCAGMLGAASWTGPVRAITAPLRLVVHFEGGSCRGTLNGRPIDHVPVRDGYVDVSGPMSCALGLGTGRGGFTLQGRAFTGAVTYRRPGITPTVTIAGDSGGTIVGLGRLVADAGEVVPLISQCLGAGLPGARLQIVQYVTLTPISSPQKRSSRRQLTRTANLNYATDIEGMHAAS